MIEDHENTAARDVIRIIGVSFGFQPLDVSLKLAKPDVHMVGNLIGRLIPFGQLVDFAPRGPKGSLILHRKLHRVRVGPTHSMRVWEIEMSFRPFPALPLPQRIGFAAELCRHQQMRWLGISDLIAEPEGPTFISYKVARSRLNRLRFVTQDPNRTSLVLKAFFVKSRCRKHCAAEWSGRWHDK